MVGARVLLILATVTFFAGKVSACTCDTKNIVADFNAAETIAFRGTVIGSSLSSQCVSKMNALPQDEKSPESHMIQEDRLCSISNTLEIQEYLKGRLSETLVVQTQPLFMGIGSCATSLPPGSTFTIVATYDGVNEISVSQCSTKFNEQKIEEARRFLKDPQLDQDFRDNWQGVMRNYDQLYALSAQYKAALAQAGEDNSSDIAGTFARVQVMVDRKDWTSAMDALKQVRYWLKSSEDKRSYDRLLAATRALMGNKAK